ncbi:MAG: tRNA lysidine(34) synthetase TilS [Pseudomonadota bacterium]
MPVLTAARPAAASSFDAIAALKPGPIGVAVSGGGDSMALLHLLTLWRETAGRDIIAFTVDHGLRPAAREEAVFVADTCAKAGVAHQTLRWTPDRETVSQAAARRARHTLLARALRDRGGAVMLTAHTLDDQAETFLMRARQGSGWRGLAGMRRIAPSPVWPEGRSVLIARPVLNQSRAALRAVLNKAGLPWIEDPSNQDPRYERVRMRRMLAGAPHVQDRIVNVMNGLDRLRRAADLRLVDSLRRRVAADALGLIRLDAAALSASDIALVVPHLIPAAAGSDASPRGDTLRRLTAALAAEGGLARRTLGGAWIDKRCGEIRIGRDPGAVRPEAVDGLWDGRFRRSAAPSNTPIDAAPAIVKAAAPPWSESGAECLVQTRIDHIADALAFDFAFSKYNHLTDGVVFA